MMKKGIGKRAKEILRKLLQGRGMRRLAIGLVLLVPLAGNAGDAYGWAEGEERHPQSAKAVKEDFPDPLKRAAAIVQR